MKRISFIMPSFNRAQFIAQSIESIFAQMSDQDELVVVDDGSTDNTQSVIQSYLARLRYVRQDNAGKSVALNRGLAMTSGRYVWICDDDDLLLPGCVNLMVSAMESSQAGMVFGRYSRFHLENGEQVNMGTGYWPDLSSGSPHRHILEDAFVMHNAALVRRESYAKLGPFDPIMLRSQDYEMFTRLALSCALVYVDSMVFLQRKHPGARGPAAIVHGAGRSHEIWEEFDRRIFHRMRDLVPLEFFVSMFDGPDAALASRAGLLQRACILARHGLWQDALGDCTVAAGLAQNQPLHPLEAAICRRMTAGKHGFAGLIETESTTAVRRLASMSQTGRAIVGQIARGLLWRVNGEDPAAHKAAVLHLLKPWNAIALAAQLLTRVQSTDEGVLWEREPDVTLNADAMQTWRIAVDVDIVSTV